MVISDDAHESGDFEPDGVPDVQPTRELNALEHFVLAMIISGFSTGFMIREALAAMPWVGYSAQSGSLYRAIRRLEARKLVESIAKDSAGSDVGRAFQATPLGRETVCKWMRSPLSSAETVSIVDPFLHRLFFLELLDPDKQRGAVLAWLTAAKESIESVSRSSRPVDAEPSSANRLTHHAYMAYLKARADWLQHLLASLV